MRSARPVTRPLIWWILATGQPQLSEAQSPASGQPAADQRLGLIRQLLDLELYESALGQLASAESLPLDPAHHQRLLVDAVEGLADDHLLCHNVVQASHRYRWLIDLPDPIPQRRRGQWRARRAAASNPGDPTDPGYAQLLPRRKGRWAVVLAGPWRQRHAHPFLIHHHNDFVARRIEAALRFHFAELCNYLALDPKAVDWPGPVNVYVHADPAALKVALPTAGRALGRSVIGLRHGQPQQLDLHLTQNAPLLLSSVLPHELAHLLIAHAVGYRPLPRYLDEGLALQVEPPAVQLRYDRLETAQASQPLPTVETLLQSAGQTPGLREHQYAQARLLADFLVGRLGLARLLDTCKRRQPTPANLVDAGSWSSLDALQQDWQAFVRDRHDHRR